MKDGRITQDGKYNDILKSGSDFMELVGAHKEALSALDSIEAGAAVVGEDSSTGNAKNFLQKKESPTDQNDKTDNAMRTNGQLIQDAKCIENAQNTTPPLAACKSNLIVFLDLPNMRKKKKEPRHSYDSFTLFGIKAVFTYPNNNGRGITLTCATQFRN
ncbi:Xenobiotic-transporting ATPase [Forsythia ovata]|uniref:Xenobiotic-transporting ATPase n=1 Tax=Forsythia ovata TaxID=205694 RepID=A0ABD1TPT7_9LAMI